MYKCICCQKVAEGDGFYTICPSCNWEADLDTREGLDAYCPVNGMTVREARRALAEGKTLSEASSELREQHLLEMVFAAYEHE